MGIKREVAFTIANCQVSPSSNCLTFTDSAQGEKEEKIALQPKFIELLSYLAHQYPNVVTRDELIEQIWEGNSYVGAKALTNAIWHLRKHLTPQVQGQPVIETVRKTGYRLLIEPQFVDGEFLDEEQRFQELETELIKQRTNFKSLAVTFAITLLLIILFAAIHLYSDSVQYLPTKLQHLTKSTGAELYPAISPNGQFLVYGSRGSEVRPSLYLKDLHNPENKPQLLTSIDSAEIRAVWGPDSQTLYYPSEQDGQCSMMRFNLNNHHAEKITDCFRYISALDISPSGNTLGYIWNEQGAQTLGLYQLALDQESAQPQRLSCVDSCNHRDRDIAYSPDGRHMLIARRFGNISEDIFIRDIVTGEEDRLTFGLEDIRGLTWHSDSKRIVFSTENSGIRNGFLLSIDDKNILNLNVEGLSYPKFIPFEDELVYANYMRDYQVASFALEQSIPTATFPLLRVEYSYRNPDYSTVNKRLVYVSNETGANEIWSSDFKGQQRKQITDLKRRVAYPSWSKDGRKIAFLAPDDSNLGNKIFVYDTQNSTLSTLATTYLDHNRPTWRGNDSVIARTADGITEFYLDNRPPRVLSSIDMRLGMMLDEQTLFFTRVDLGGLWKLNLSELNDIESDTVMDKNVAEPVIGEEQFDEYYNWTVSDKGVYFRQSSLDFQLINFWRAGTELITPLLKLPAGTLPRSGAMSYSPDNNSLFLTLSQNYKRDIIKLQHKLLQ